MRNTFRADANRSASRQKFPRGNEGLMVLRHVLALVLAPVNGQRVDSFNEITYDGHVKQWRLGQKRNLSRREAKQEHRIDQGVWVIEYENDGGFEWDVFETGDLNTLEVDPQREPYEGDYQATNHCSAILGHEEAQKAQMLKSFSLRFSAYLRDLCVEIVVNAKNAEVRREPQRTAEITSSKLDTTHSCFLCLFVAECNNTRAFPIDSKFICSRKIHEAFCCYRCCLIGWAMLARRGAKPNLHHRRPAQGASRQRSAGFS